MKLQEMRDMKLQEMRDMKSRKCANLAKNAATHRTHNPENSKLKTKNPELEEDPLFWANSKFLVPDLDPKKSMESIISSLI